MTKYDEQGYPLTDATAPCPCGGSAPMTNPSTAGFELEDAQGGSRSTPITPQRVSSSKRPRAAAFPITPQRVSSSKRPRAAPARWDAGTFSDSSAGRCKTSPALWILPTRVGRGRGTAETWPAPLHPHSVGPLPFAGSPHAELECILHLFGDRNRGGACESKDQATGSGGDTGEIEGRRWGSR
jgi:hypothetical protein